MNLDNVIENRKSIRKYSSKKVDIKLIGQLLETATKAPSAGNIQNWKFIIVSEKETKNKLTKACLNQNWMKTAPVFIIVCSDTQIVKKFYPKRAELYAPQNCAIACTYILLKATDLGLGTCWVGAFAPQAVQKILHLPDPIVPEAIITIGYPQKDVLRKTPRTAYKKLTWFEKFGRTQQQLDFSLYPLDKHLKKLKKQ